MEFDRTPPGAADPGMYGCDREVFERVWRRVMPEDQYGSPVELFGEDRAQSRLYDTEGGGPDPWLPEPPIAPPVPPMEPPVCQPPQPEPPESHCPCADPAVRCLGESSSIYGAQLQAFIADELSDYRTYTAIVQRVRGNGKARGLSSIAADELRHAKRLSTAYFLISGVRYWPMPQGMPRLEGSFPAQLRMKFCGEQRGEAAYLAAAEATQDPCLRELYKELAGDENSHAWLIRGILEEM